jgi:hypothetical protein
VALPGEEAIAGVSNPRKAMVAKYDLGSGDFDISTSTATLAYTWLRFIHDFTDGISVTGLALSTNDILLATAGSYSSSPEYL